MSAGDNANSAAANADGSIRTLSKSVDNVFSSFLLSQSPLQKDERFIRLSQNLFTGPQVTKEDFMYLKDLGIKTVINLREENEAGFFGDRAAFEEHFVYVHEPMNSSALGTTFTEQEADSLMALLDKNPKPAFVFCRSGKRAAAVGTAHHETRKNAETHTKDAIDVAKVPEDDPMRPFLKTYIHSKLEKALKRPGISKLSDSLYVGSQPTEDELEKFKALGVKSVLNLRDPKEAGKLGMGVLAREHEICQKLGLEYVNHPVTMVLSDEDRKKLLELMKEMPKPVLVHCAMRARADVVGQHLKENSME